MVGVPLALLCAAGALFYCGKIVWIKTGEQGRVTPNLNRPNILS